MTCLVDRKHNNCRTSSRTTGHRSPIAKHWGNVIVFFFFFNVHIEHFTRANFMSVSEWKFFNNKLFGLYIRFKFSNYNYEDVFIENSIGNVQHVFRRITPVTYNFDELHHSFWKWVRSSFSFGPWKNPWSWIHLPGVFFVFSEIFHVTTTFLRKTRTYLNDIYLNRKVWFFR